jgi:hypothetical protein
MSNRTIKISAVVFLVILVAAISAVSYAHRPSPLQGETLPAVALLAAPPPPDAAVVNATLAALATTTSVTWDQARELLTRCGVVRAIRVDGTELFLMNGSRISIEGAQDEAAVTGMVNQLNTACTEKIYRNASKPLPINVPATTDLPRFFGPIVT